MNYRVSCECLATANCFGLYCYKKEVEVKFFQIQRGENRGYATRIEKPQKVPFDFLCLWAILILENAILRKEFYRRNFAATIL